jgi:glycosyltransferase involved in cell wall biosynthesis
VVEVAFDSSPLALSRAGTARYITGLLDGLGELEGVRLRRHEFPLHGRPTIPLRDVGWYLGALPLLARGADVLHCPTFRAPVASSVPLVVTFFDVAVLRHPDAFNAWTRAYSRAVLPAVARRGDRIVTISRFSADEVASVLGVPDEKLRVIPLAAAAAFRADGERGDGDYILAVGTLEPRKNLPRLVEAFRRAQLDGCELRIVGARGWGGVEPVRAENVRWLGEVDDEELARLYRGARCSVYVSLYEGFGLPVLEAMACGCAVVASDLPPIREFGRGIVYVDPADVDAIAAGLREAVTRRRELGAEGEAAAAAYSWRRVAEETADVYRELAA